MGLYKRVTLGFMSIVVVLILSGVVSFIELSALSRDTNRILDVNRKDREFATQLLQALHEQNNAFVEITAFNMSSSDSVSLSSVAKMERILLDNRLKSVDSVKMDSMLLLTRKIKILTEDLVDYKKEAAIEARKAKRAAAKAQQEAAAAAAQQQAAAMAAAAAQQDSLSATTNSATTNNAAANSAMVDNTAANNATPSNAKQVPQSAPVQIEKELTAMDFFNEYRPIYQSMLNLISQYMTASTDSLTPEAQQLHHNAYRALAPVLISLVVMIAILLMLYFFMLLICVNPIVKINKSLTNYINFKIPFAPKCFARDELEQICDGIETIIKSPKN